MMSVFEEDDEIVTDIIDTTNWGYLWLRRPHYEPAELLAMQLELARHVASADLMELLLKERLVL